MTVTELFHMLSCIFGGAAAILITALVFRAPERELKRGQRAGAGLMGAATVMLLPHLFTQAATVFDPWASTLLWFGLLVFYSASGYRAIDHWIRGEIHARRGPR
jgi:protein-S-isoprenylcysteine O-methyltransferase Ste14